MRSSRILQPIQSLALIKRCEETNYCGAVDFKGMIPFKIGGESFGALQPGFAAKLLENHCGVFFSDGKCMRFQPELENGTREDKTRAIGLVNEQLRKEGTIKGWRDEMLPVVQSFNGDPAFLIERAACAYYGMKAYGVHVNGYERNDTNYPSMPTHLWVGTRSTSKQTYPHAFDHIVAGGLAHGVSPFECVVKECREEASIPEDLAKRAHPTGSLSYRSVDEFGQIRNDIIFTFDLDLTNTNFTPVPADDEVECFDLRNIDWILDTLCESKPRYKPNCSLVVIDFLIRHGIISPESPQYLEITDKLRTMPLR